MGLFIMRRAAKHFDFTRHRSNQSRAFRELTEKEPQIPAVMELYRRSYSILHGNLLDIKREFSRLAVVGPCSHLLFQLMETTPTLSKRFESITVCDVSEASLAFSQKHLADST